MVGVSKGMRPQNFFNAPNKEKMQLTKEKKLFLCSSALAPRLQRANRATRKMLNIETDKVKSMTTPAKAPWESRSIEGNLAGKSHVKLILATVNVGSMVGRSAEVTETIARRNVQLSLTMQWCRKKL